jgi:PKD repeat protein
MMHKARPYLTLIVPAVMLAALFWQCRREPLTDRDGEPLMDTSAFRERVVKLDTLVFMNPVTGSGQIRFDLVSTAPQIQTGDIIYYPANDGFYGKVLTVATVGSRMYFQIDTVGVDQVFSNLVLHDQVSRSRINRQFRDQPGRWQQDSMDLAGFEIFNGFIEEKSLRVSFSTGTLHSSGSVDRFYFAGQGTNPWFDRIGMDYSYSQYIDATVRMVAGNVLDGSGSVLVESTVYGPYMLGEFPLTYRVDTWVGFRTKTGRDTTLTFRLTGLTQGTLSLKYNYWEDWQFSQTHGSQTAIIQSYQGSRYSSYLGEVSVSQVVTPLFCGIPSVSLSNHFSAAIQSDVVLPEFQSSQSAQTWGGMTRSGPVFGTSPPTGLTTPEILLYSESQNGTLVNLPPKAAFTIDPVAGYTDTNFEFDASGCTDLETPSADLQVRWDFDGDNHFDTEFSTGKIAYYKYPQAGIYRPVLEVKDAGDRVGRMTSSVEVSISTSAPIAYFTVTPQSGRISDIFLFNAYGSYDAEDNIDQLKVRWDFDGDGIWDTGWSTQKNEYHIYRDSGRYVAKLEVLDTQGLTGSTSRIVNVALANIKPTAFFTVDPESGTTETRFRFDASGSTDPEDPVSSLEVRWDWNNDGLWDTEYRTVKTIEHIFAQAGTYTVVLEVIDTEGYGSTYAKQIVVTNPNTPPNAEFSITPSTGHVNETITFDASLSTDAEDSTDKLQVRWDWNNDNVYDTDFTTDKIAKQVFPEAGTFIIKLQVKDTGGLTATRVKLVIIQ